jgi:hypothetical protein
MGTGKFVIDSVAACGRSIEHARMGHANAEGESLTTLEKQIPDLPKPAR